MSKSTEAMQEAYGRGYRVAGNKVFHNDKPIADWKKSSLVKSGRPPYRVFSLNLRGESIDVCTHMVAFDNLGVLSRPQREGGRTR